MLIIWLPMEPLLWEIGETATALRRAFDRRAADLGVTRAQWRALARISRQPGLRQVELAEQLDIEAITLCRIIDRLEESGLVERQRDPADRRAWQLLLTDKAQPLVDRLTELANGFGDEIFSGLNAADRKSLRAGLASVRANIASGDPRKKASNG